MIKLLTTAFAALLIGSFSFTNAQDAGRGGPGATWQVQKYDLDVGLPTGNSRTMTAKAILSIKNVSGSPASTLTLRITPDAAISTVKINDSTVDFSKSEEKIASGRLQRIASRFPAVAPNAALSVVVDYKIDVKENSPLGSITPAGSNFLPLSFWYPTPNSWFFTKGGDIAPIRLKVSAPTGQRVIASGLESNGVHEQKLGSQPFFITGNWETATHGEVTVFMPVGAGAEGQKRAAEMAALYAEAVTFMAGVLGKAPESPLRLVASRRGAGFASAGTLIVEEAAFRRPKIDSLSAMNIAEAAARLWLGNAVRVTGDGHGAISEGLTRYLATQFLESKFGKDVASVERSRQLNAYAAVSKRDAPITVVSPLDDYYYPVVGNKGAMAWRLLAGRVGQTEFANIIRGAMQDGVLELGELRTGFAAHNDLVNYLFDQVTDMNLRIGLPQALGSEYKSVLLNSGTIDATVDVVATTATGEKLTTTATIKAGTFGEAVFRTQAKVVRVEIDSENLYPQTDYSDDVQPRESSDSDPVLAAKRLFDKQDFAGAETTARLLLRDAPRLDDLRIILGRALLAQNKNAEAEKEFRIVLDEKLPSARSIAWANIGLAEAASRSNQRETALRHIEAAIASDADYGATLAARNLRSKIGTAADVDATIRAFFAEFDKAASSNRKADVEWLIMPGEVTRFAAGVSGSTESWQTQIRHVDRVDANTVLVETNMAVKLLNKDQETGLAVYRLVRVGGAWKLAAVEMFEVR